MRTLETVPPDGGTHWSTRQMAASVGLSQSTVSRVWRAFGLQPHRLKHWKLSKDPLFVEKVRDIVGLYLDPPERAIVLCVDEKSQIQALDRSAPILPVLPGCPARATHDYTRHRRAQPARGPRRRLRQGHRLRCTRATGRSSSSAFWRPWSARSRASLRCTSSSTTTPPTRRRP